MVRAILEGRKTQTRRLVDPQWDSDVEFVSECPNIDPFLRCIISGHSGVWEDEHGLDQVRGCPYGIPGDRLWVKETWAAHEYYNGRRPVDIPEGVTIECREMPNAVTTEGNGHREISTGERGRWRPSIFMRRWMSRITLEVVNVRVERLQCISEADALAEGIDHYVPGVTAALRGESEADPIIEYRSLWESINGAGSWISNPWVWVIEFRRSAR